MYGVFVIIACSRLQDSQARGIEKAGTREKKRQGTGERGRRRLPSFSFFSRPAPIFVRPTLSCLPRYLRAWNRLLSLQPSSHEIWACPDNTATPLIQPNVFDPLVTTLTGFHSTRTGLSIRAGRPSKPPASSPSLAGYHKWVITANKK